MSHTHIYIAAQLLLKKLRYNSSKLDQNHCPVLEQGRRQPLEDAAKMGV